MAKNNIFNIETYKKVNKNNKELLEDYILELKSKKKSQGTIKQYESDIKMFFCWSYDNLDNKYILSLKKRQFRNFFLYLQDERGLSTARINRIQCSLRNLLEFASQDEDEYDYDQNIMSKIKGLTKESVRPIVFLSDEQIFKIRDFLVDNKEYQKVAYLMLAYDSAARRNELRQVLKTDLLINNKTNTVVGKRNKKFSLLLFEESKKAIYNWLEYRGEDDIESLFIAGTNGNNRREASYELLHSWAKNFADIISEIEGQRIELNSHSIRHSALENMSNGTHYVLRQRNKNALDLNTLRVYANHSDVSTTQGYLKNRDSELLENAFDL